MVEWGAASRRAAWIKGNTLESRLKHYATAVLRAIRNPEVRAFIKREGMSLWHAVQERLAMSATAPRPVAGDRFGTPTLMQRRLEQGAVRLAVTDGYNRRCAISGEKTLPILDAAHIRSYASGGEHEVANGLLLRTDIHKLFDQGYVTITREMRFADSERLKADFRQRQALLRLAGRELAVPRPGFAAPSAEALRRHR